MLNYFLSCQESYEEGDDIWFSSYAYNGLYRVNRRTKVIQRMAAFPGEKGYVSMLYKAIVRVKDWLVFAPCAAEEIAVYNYKKNEMKKIPLRDITVEHKVRYQKDLKFWTAVSYGNYAYLFGWCYPAILRLNPETGETVYYTEWLEKLDKKIRGNPPGYYSDGIVRGKVAYLPCLWAGVVLKYDLESNVAEIIEVKPEIEGFYGITDDGMNLWLVPWECQNIVKWNPDSGAVNEICISYKNKHIFPFHKPLLIEKKIYLLPFGIKDVYRIDSETGMIERCREWSEALNIKIEEYSIGDVMILAFWINPNGFCYISNRDYSWHTYDVRTGVECTTYWEAKEEREYIKRLYIGDKISEGDILMECQEVALISFLDCLTEKTCLEKDSMFNENTGKKIYKSISSALNLKHGRK